MITKRFTGFALVLLSAVLLLSFSACDMVDVGLQADEAADSRKISQDADASEVKGVGKPVPFEAEIYLIQAAADSNQVGSGKHWRTNDEVLMGWVTSSDWDLLVGGTIYMTNFTNFNLDPIYPDYGFYPAAIKGTNHSVVTITTPAGETLTFTANGKLEGEFPVAADVEMNFSMTGKSNVAGVKNARGSLSGAFAWTFYGDTPVAYGNFTLTGTYN
jgi:hypothetical protein